jgi:hypothetical protein
MFAALLGLTLSAAPEMARLDSYLVQSDYLGAPTRIDVLAPRNLDPARPPRVLYVLPVNAGLANQWGDCLAEVVRANLAERYCLLCVFPSFDQIPWYADHPSDPHRRQESHLLQVVMPLIGSHYAVAPKPLLVGVSRAAAWDAPLMEQAPGRFEGMIDVFRDAAGFAPYRLSDLFAAHATEFQGQPRLALMGYGNFQAEMAAGHELLTRLGVAHEWRAGPPRAHRWDSGWLPEAVAWLAGP